jgi:CrcB protein
VERPRLLVVALGAVIGATVRWAALDVAGPSSAAAALLIVNVAGCALAGAVLAGPGIGRLTPRRSRDLLVVGLCGALTSWSTLAVQLAQDTRAGNWSGAAGWLVANLALGLGVAAVAHRAVSMRRARPDATGQGRPA